MCSGVCPGCSVLAFEEQLKAIAPMAQEPVPRTSRRLAPEISQQQALTVRQRLGHPLCSRDLLLDSAAELLFRGLLWFELAGRMLLDRADGVLYQVAVSSRPVGLPAKLFAVIPIVD